MTVLWKICAFALISALCALMVHAHHRQAGRLVSLCAGMMMLSFAVTQITPVVQALQDFSREAGLQSDTIALLLRLISMAYLTEFSVQGCRDAGEEGLAMKCALAGKILLAAQTVPLITEIGTLAMDMLP